MLALSEAQPVKLFVGALWADKEAWGHALRAMERIWGEVDVRGQPVPFTSTDYYRDEMGSVLFREFVSFTRLVSAAELPALKLASNRIELDLSEQGKRAVNLDVGYLDYHKVVLASTKPGPHRVYLDRGIWADMTLMYRKGDYHELPWTFMDFGSGLYNGFLLAARERYKTAVRQRGPG